MPTHSRNQQSQKEEKGQEKTQGDERTKVRAQFSHSALGFGFGVEFSTFRLFDRFSLESWTEWTSRAFKSTWPFSLASRFLRELACTRYLIVLLNLLTDDLLMTLLQASCDGCACLQPSLYPPFVAGRWCAWGVFLQMDWPSMCLIKQCFVNIEILSFRFAVCRSSFSFNIMLIVAAQ